MTKKLLVVFASGLVLSILLLSAAWVIGGSAMITRIDKEGGFNFTFDDDDNPHLVMTTRTLAFDDSKPLEVAAPVKLHFTRGEKVEMTVKGPQKLVEAVRWENGRLSLHDTSLFSHHHTLTVEITAPKMPALSYKGAGNIDLEGLDQPELALDMAGAGKLDASGKVGTLTVHSHGAGDLDLGDLEAKDATVSAAGVGNIDLSATGKVDITVSGVGNVSLHRKPAELTSRVTGIGSVNQDY